MRLPRLKKKHRRDLQYALIRGLIRFFGMLPRGAALVLGGALGALAFSLLRDAREKAVLNLTSAFRFPGRSKEARQLARATFSELGRSAVDLCQYPRFDRRNIERMVRVEGLEHVERGYRLGRGIVAITCHMGNWELIPLYFSLKGYPVSVIGRELYDPRLDELLVALRESKGIRSLERDRSGREALRVLRRGECLGVLIDQDTSVGGDFVPFFGQPAHTPTGPLALAAKTGASVLPMAIHREPDSTYVITVNPPLDLTRTADRKEDLRTNTARVTAILEHFIRTHPTQWVWFHDRWRTKPPAKDEPDQGARGAGTPDEQTNT